MLLMLLRRSSGISDTIWLVIESDGLGIYRLND